MEITTGSPEARVPASSGVTDTVGTAESVLTSRTGAPVRLADPEDLGGSDRSVVMRVRVAETPFELPRTLVVKHYGAPSGTERSDPFAHEAASCQLATALPPEIRVGPELIAQDSDRRLLVLEDLGRGSTLADVLFADDPRAAERALLAWARSLGRLHTTMAGREADFDALMRRLGATSWTDPVAEDIRQALTELPEVIEQTLGVAIPQAVTERLDRAAQLLAASKYRSFSPSDICPDNSLVTGNGARFLDFEWACVRDIALDAAYLQFPFPSSWCSYAMPEHLAESMLATWRSEVVEVWPDLDQDEVLRPRLFEAQMLWVWVSTWWFLPRAGQADTPIAAHMPSPRRSTALAERWKRLCTDAETSGNSEVAEYANRVVDALVERFGSGALELRTYPAFR
ncbi:thiamine kinase-like enzyme [Halopolyspora algeriensis]|uniref:Thiamine kinase-like enzyme n=1 Tax=Halopolyspora algeriensis TaxID=1500506 RepID=A0A368VWJ7_9ACTN|nr:thiamine kinase-like enzyme [Halopolyspora algeriensis]TQM53604.1 thiamine kinase-like enzyme [Halopolyspora algeriensis]